MKTDPRSIDTFRVPFPAVLKLKSCDFAVKNADAPGVQKQTFTSRKSIRAQWEKAVTHRDHSFRGDYIRVSMFDDRLEILSPGGAPEHRDARQHEDHPLFAQPAYRAHAG